MPPIKLNHFCEDPACLQEPIPRRPERCERQLEQSSRKRANVKAMTVEERKQHKEEQEQRKRERMRATWRDRNPPTAAYAVERRQNPNWQPKRKRT
jgi:hypothetical protein